MNPLFEPLVSCVGLEGCVDLLVCGVTYLLLLCQWDPAVVRKAGDAGGFLWRDILA